MVTNQLMVEKKCMSYINVLALEKFGCKKTSICQSQQDFTEEENCGAFNKA